MKKFFCLTLAFILTISLAACNGTENTDNTSESATEAEVIETAKDEVLTTNKQGFFHFTHSFGNSWTVDSDRSTNVCLCASYKESDSSTADFVLSATLYDDQGGAGKAQSIANSVKQREESSSEIMEKEFGGIKFYGVCFDSYEHNGKRLCNMFGQTEPSADGSYYFIEIFIDNMTADSTLNKIDSDLKTLNFSF